LVPLLPQVTSPLYRAIEIDTQSPPELRGRDLAQVFMSTLSHALPPPVALHNPLNRLHRLLRPPLRERERERARAKARERVRGGTLGRE
jgi:hypothetical protein